jgi:hypothetical protein
LAPTTSHHHPPPLLPRPPLNLLLNLNLKLLLEQHLPHQPVATFSISTLKLLHLLLGHRQPKRISCRSFLVRLHLLPPRLKLRIRFFMIIHMRAGEVGSLLLHHLNRLLRHRHHYHRLDGGIYRWIKVRGERLSKHNRRHNNSNINSNNNSHNNTNSKPTHGAIWLPTLGPPTTITTQADSEDSVQLKQHQLRRTIRILSPISGRRYVLHVEWRKC